VVTDLFGHNTPKSPSILLRGPGHPPTSSICDSRLDLTKQLAIDKIVDYGLRATYLADGKTVIDQDPDSGTSCDCGDEVMLTLSNTRIE
jgi:hypothetical protein